jgi:hypothetical protein
VRARLNKEKVQEQVEQAGGLGGSSTTHLRHQTRVE